MSKLGISIDSSDLTSIYNDYNPAYKNLYTVYIYPRSNTEEDESIATHIKFHTLNVSFNGESLRLTRNAVTKKFQLNANNPYTWSDSLTITWRESDTWKVKKYHEDWLKLFYNKNDDCFISYPTNSSDKYRGHSVDSLYRSIKVVLPNSSGSTDESKEMNSIVFEDVLPSNVGDFQFGWSSSPDVVTHSLKYFVGNWHWIGETSQGISSSSGTDSKTMKNNNFNTAMVIG